MPTAVDERHLDLEAMEIDPYPVYGEMRDESPVAYIPELDLWMVTRWDDVEHVAAGKEIWGSPKTLYRLNRTFGEPNILTSEGPQHDSQRAAIDPGLRPRAVNGYVDELVRPIAGGLIADLAAKGGAELVSEFLEPVSVLGLGALMGLGDLDSDTLRNWFQGLITGAGNATHKEARFDVAASVIEEIESYVNPILDDLENDPDDSLLSHMLFSGMPEGKARPRSEIFPTYNIILAGGMQEPGHAGATVMLGLLTNTDQLRQVIDDSSLIPKAVIEGLRWIAPIGQSVRSPLEDTEIGKVVIPKGAIVNAMIASANRDERKFQRPDEFDINRSPNEQMAFGHGTHFCAGHFFARQLQRIALDELLSAFPSIELDPEYEPVVRGWVFRAPQELRVRWMETGRS